eukprot:6372519-Amphidinium_carterae.1
MSRCIGREGYEEEHGQIRALSRSTFVHGVLIGDVAFPLDIWVTLCGWHFGYSRHLTSGEKVTCRRCLGLVGGKALWGEVSGKVRSAWWG